MTDEQKDIKKQVEMIYALEKEMERLQEQQSFYIKENLALKETITLLKSKQPKNKSQER